MLGKKLSLTMACIMAGMSLIGCSSSVGNAETNSGKLQIVCTNFSEYDWVRQILGNHADEVQLTYLLSDGVDMHNYQPTASDMVKISGCDMFVYVGGESDKWVDDALAEAANPNLKAFRLLDVITAKEEEEIEGMEEEHDEEDHDDDEPEFDEHVWLSVRNAQIICSELEQTLETIDPENANDYKSNFNSYQTELIHLDEDFNKCYSLSSGINTTLVFADRFPFRYFVDDYGYKYYAAFAGCSAETEASFETVAFLAKQLDDPQNVCSCVYVIEGGKHDLAEAVISNTESKNFPIRELNSIQSVTSEQIANGATYVSLMRGNLEVLKEASGQSW